ncbi:disulfide bond formation protein DsbA [bacterium]|nr:disulfide bond formation protein DsbA [bacterium]
MEITTETKTLIGVLAVTILIIVAGGFFAGRGNAPAGSVDEVVDSERLVRAHSPFAGPADAAVTVVEFADFQCPACGSLHPVLELVKEANPDVRFVFRQFPLTQIHEFAQGAAEASLAANAQGKFWEYHDLLFENQSQLTRDDLITHAGTVGLDVSRFTSELDEAVYRSEVGDDRTDGNILGVRGTPTLYINGVQYQDQYSVHGLQAAIDSARGK